MFDTLITKLKLISKDKALSGTIIVTIGILINAIFSYFLQFVLGKHLSLEDYGTFNALLAFSSIIGVPTTVLSISLIKNVSDLKAAGDFHKLTKAFWQLCLCGGLAGLVMVAAFEIFKTSFASFLKISDTSIVIIFAINHGISILYTIAVSYLQGLLRFKAFAFNYVVIGVFRLSLPVIAVILGYKVGGVFAGIGVAGIIAFSVAVLNLRKNFISGDTYVTLADLKPMYKKILLFSGPVLFVNLSMMLMNNIDLVLVKRFFDGDSAGLYAGVVTVGKILLFGAGAVTVVMFPQISEVYASGANYWGKLKQFFIMQLGLIAAGVLVFALVPQVIVGVFFGAKFMAAVPYVAGFSVFIGLYVLINFLVTFLLAIEKTKVFLMQIPAVVLQVVGLYLFHDSLYQVIAVNFVVSLLLLLGLGGYLLILRRRII